MLTKAELASIKVLEEMCEKDGGFQLKLNFDMLENRTGNNKEDFFHYEDGELVGFLASYGFGNKVELCGMVHPDHRRKGIFTRLLEMGLEETKKRRNEETKHPVDFVKCPNRLPICEGIFKEHPLYLFDS